jgi:hypothetical protein
MNGWSIREDALMFPKMQAKIFVILIFSLYLMNQTLFYAQR